MNRRHLIKSALWTRSLAVPALADATPSKVEAEVCKSLDCGCCKAWLTHLRHSRYFR